jgi:demethylmenaquinone methyltransferase/2-methoxy-6-polyprenyl-1,4-benzoquinol methylase
MGTTAEKTPWLAKGEEKREEVRGMFADIAGSYDLVNSLICLRMHHRWRRAAVKVIRLGVGERALDVCTGTGDFLVPLMKAVGPGGTALGVDFCGPMLARARTKLPGAGLALGDACRLPLQDGAFDGATVGWGLRNVPDVNAALKEVARVLRAGGRFVTLDMARPKNGLVGRVSEWAFHTVVPLVGRVFGKSRAYMYLPKSTLQFLTRDEMKRAMEQAGFSDVRTRDFAFGNVCMHWGTKS